MKNQSAYCSACDRDVQIVITDEPSQDGHANVHDSEIVCLEIGETCSGALGPIGATAPSVMAARLVRNGLQTIVQPAVRAYCANCERATSHVLIEKDTARCTECEGVTPRDDLLIVAGI